VPVEFVRQPAGLGEPLGKYSHVAIATGTQIVAVAGQVGTIRSGQLGGDGSVGAQTRQAFENVATALRSLDLGPRDIFKTTTYLVGSSNIAEFMQARAAVFEELFPDGNYPPNTLLVVAALVEDTILVEVEALAIRAAG
jgi:enamine deaminase RidA (YjgF/YER057c/UK114 family)